MKRILLVDDIEDNLYMLQSLFTANNYSVYRARDGKEALEHAANFLPNVIISDILMPVMDGFTFCRELKKHTSLKDIPFLFYTATYTDHEDEKLALSLGADRFLIKPTDPGRLLQIVEEVLEEHAEGREVSTKKQPREKEYLQVYNASLIRKLEDKLGELKQINRTLANEVMVRKRAEEEAEASLQEKKVLLKEVYHRTKNNMQVIIGLLDLQSRKTSSDETLRVLRDMGSRIYSMSLVHDLLYRSHNLAEIKLNTYLSKLAHSLIAIYENEKMEIKLLVDSVDVPINLQFAVPLGLVINEIISNSLKHAFPDKKVGTITIDARAYGKNGIDLTIKDNGIGLKKLEIEALDTLGMRLVQEVVEGQLMGDLDIDTTDGLQYTISIPNVTLED